MRLVLLSAAEEDLRDAIAYYDAQSEGLGHEFEAAVRRSFETIARDPEAWARLTRFTRRYCLRRFPYAIIYHFDGNSILVLAVEHNHRHPNAWRARLRQI